MTSEPAFHTPLLQTMTHSWLLHCLVAAIKLRLPDALSEQPQTSQQLADRLHVHEPSLRRLLHALVANRFVRQHQGGYVLTTAGEDLRSDRRDTLVPFALFQASPLQRRSWDALDKALQDGTPAVEHAVGEPLFSYLGKNAEEATLFNRAMQAMSTRTVEAVARHRDLSQIETFVDLGGGVGVLAAALLQHHSNLRGSIFDIPMVQADANKFLTQAGVQKRCRFVPGDLLEDAPPPAQLYLFKAVLANWDDARAVQMLKQVRRAMPEDAALWIVEPLMTAETDTWATLLDMQMLVSTGGRIRTEAEFRELVARCDLKISQVRTVADTHVLVVQRGR